jgi:hypothetical protein
MRKNFATFTEEEQAIFGFVNRHRKVVGEFDMVFSCVNKILKRLKNEGLLWSMFI